ncbi:MAG TPA: hypothetical protein VF538_00405 [Pyrinomonadaceae bacterium]|jgi:hypothetical protein
MSSNQRNGRGGPLDLPQGCIRYLLIVSSIIGLLGWSYVVLVTVSYFGWGWWLKTRSSPSQLFLYFFPFVYLISGVLLSTVKVNKRVLICAAVILNLPIGAYGVYRLLTRGFDLLDLIWLCFIALWAILCATGARKTAP